VITDSFRKEQLWRWLGLTVGGTVLPFAIFVLAYWLVSHRVASPQAILGRGELFIPASIMNAEAIWIFKYITLRGWTLWYPIIVAACGLAALGGAVCFGITAALEVAPHTRVLVSQTELQQPAKSVTILSGGEFVLAFLVGTTGVVLFMLMRGQEDSPS
jgi:hypothetical protein